MPAERSGSRRSGLRDCGDQGCPPRSRWTVCGGRRAGSAGLLRTGRASRVGRTARGLGPSVPCVMLSPWWWSSMPSCGYGKPGAAIPGPSSACPPRDPRRPGPGRRIASRLRFTAGAGHARRQHMDHVDLPGERPSSLCAAHQACCPRGRDPRRRRRRDRDRRTHRLRGWLIRREWSGEPAATVHACDQVERFVGRPLGH